MYPVFQKYDARTYYARACKRETRRFYLYIRVWANVARYLWLVYARDCETISRIVRFVGMTVNYNYPSSNRWTANIGQFFGIPSAYILPQSMFKRYLIAPFYTIDVTREIYCPIYSASLLPRNETGNRKGNRIRIATPPRGKLFYDLDS